MLLMTVIGIKKGARGECKRLMVCVGFEVSYIAIWETELGGDLRAVGDHSGQVDRTRGDLM